MAVGRRAEASARDGSAPEVDRAVKARPDLQLTPKVRDERTQQGYGVRSRSRSDVTRHFVGPLPNKSRPKLQVFVDTEDRPLAPKPSLKRLQDDVATTIVPGFERTSTYVRSRPVPRASR